MELQNFRLIQNYSNKDDKLRSLEKKQESIISILKRECEKLDGKSEVQVSPYQKFWKKKQVERNYTVKFPVTKKNEVEPKETYKHGWRVKSPAIQNPERVEKSELRSKMIVVGNFFSMSNKTSKTTVKMQRNKSALEVKQEMLIKAKQLGNQYSLLFNKKFTKNSIGTAELDRFQRLLTKKREAEKFYERSRKSGNEISEKFMGRYGNLVKEIHRLKKILKMGNRNFEGKKLVKLHELENL